MPGINLYDVTVPVLINSLTTISQVLKKAVDTAPSKSLDPQTLSESRIIADMRPLPFQIVSACNTAKFLAVRLANMENEVHEDDQVTFDDMQERITKTIAFLKRAKREDFEGAEDRTVVLFKTKFSGLEYVQVFGLPNFFFHVVTAYDILRKEGIEVGKMDFLGDIRSGKETVE